MNILKRFLKSFESKEPILGEEVKINPNRKSSWERRGVPHNPDQMIANTKCNVPWQIWQHNDHGVAIQGSVPTYEFVGNKRISTYSCGCKFEEGLKTYSWYGHWCNIHARRVEYGSGVVVQPTKQDKPTTGWVNGNTFET